MMGGVASLNRLDIDREYLYSQYSFSRTIQKLRREAVSSRSVIVLEQSTEAASTADWSLMIGQDGIRHDQHVTDALMISPNVIMGDEFTDDRS